MHSRALKPSRSWPVRWTVTRFRSEFEAGYHTPAQELFPYGKSALFTSETAGAHA